jgi:hypothetical protein
MYDNKNDGKLRIKCSVIIAINLILNDNKTHIYNSVPSHSLFTTLVQR